MPIEATASPNQRAALRRFLVRFLPLLCLGVLAILFSYWRERGRDREVAGANARGVLAVQHRMLDGELQVLLSTLRYLASQTTVGDYLEDPRKREAVEDDFLAFCRQSGMFDQIRLLDESGSETVRIDYHGGEPASVPTSALQSKAERYYFQVTADLNPLEVYISPFDLNVEHGTIESPWKPVIRLATVTAAGAERSVLVLNYLGENLLDRLHQAAAPIGGWSALVTPDGHFLQGPSEDLSWGFMFGAEPTFARSHTDAWKALKAQGTGSLSTSEGMYAFRPFQPESNTSGRHSDLHPTLVTFTPNLLLYANSSRVLGILALVGMGVALLLALGTWQLALAAEVRAAHEQRLELSERHLRDLSARLLDAQEAERRTLSRDLHDELGQLATAVTIDIQQSQRNPDDRGAHIERALAGVGEILKRVREISSRLRNSLLDDLGLRDALLDQCSEFTIRSGLEVDAQVRIDENRIPEQMAIHVYRIVQESLNNVMRHAGASSVTVRVRLDGEHVVIEVIDDGTGFDTTDAQGKSLGLTGMHERVDLLAGTLDIDSEPSRGTHVRASIPLQARPFDRGMET